ncbi:MAG TPA: exo-beta-N-acetylmuramidase NamZ domain-containing protein [Thermoanaerobaculia bacterium]|nr:exo-beta-N-acetylmuramidase NamZ domain-containing protein [Thermoanaerobaculia bacterium]
MIFAILLAALSAASPLDRIDAVISESISKGEAPGAVVLIESRGRVRLRRAWGRRALLPAPEPMTAGTVFDVASLTKAVATAPSVMILVEAGKIRLSDPVVRYIPEFGAGGGDRDKVTVEHLLTHRAGFPPDDPLDLYTGTPEEIFARKYARPLERPPGAEFVYSDVGYEVLGELVRRVSGERLDVFARKRIFLPLGMKDTAFLPLAHGIPVSRIAPTEERNGKWMRGDVHDPRAFAVGGVAGHAGLFSTADDLAKFCRMILAGGRLATARILSPYGVLALTRPRFYGDGRVRALGFDIATGYSGNRGDLFPAGSFGHTGFTGTSLWIDPASRTFVVFLSNRVHPEGKGDVGRLRSLVATIAAAAIEEDVRPKARLLMAAVPAPARDVRAGLDALIEDGFRPIAGRRVGLVTNVTGRARDGRSTAEVLMSPEAMKAGVNLAMLFSPEHGLRTDADAPVEDSVDPGTRLPIRSLYGESRRPLPQDLAGLDAVVFDLQDVGTRFYTYLTTLGYVLEEAAKAKVAVVVLDRPDPIGGLGLEGPLADQDKLSFTAYHSIPVRPGMTIGELAGLFNAERKIGADLTVIKMRGWERSLWYDETGLEWVNPSPNMRSLAAATLYPGVGLLETTNLSVGRGTATPFEVIGAPWIDGRRLAAYLSARQLPGVRFSPVHFTPDDSVFARQLCGGLRFTIVERDALKPVALGVEIASALHLLYPVEWQMSRLGALLANAAALQRLEAGDPPDAIAAGWKKEIGTFGSIRAKYLLYE